MKISLFLNLKSIFLNLFLVCLVLLLIPITRVHALTQVSSRMITVTATVGEPKLTLFGYTSPSAVVNLTGIGVASQTTADQTGYFYFNKVFLPLPTIRLVNETQKELAYPELYLQAVDTNNRASSPVILPTLPIGPYEISVGPILISPTLTVEKGVFSPGEQIIASGQTIPNTEVTIYLANDQPKKWLDWFWKIIPFSFFNPPNTYAYFIPKYQIVSNNNGAFQFNLPNNINNGNVGWKVFASTSYLEAPSPKSNSLSFSILNFWQWIWLQIKNAVLALFVNLRPFLFWLIVLTEVLAIALLFYLNTKGILTEKFSGKQHEASDLNSGCQPPLR